MKQWMRTYKKEINIFFICMLFAFCIVVFHLLFHSVRLLGMDTSIFYMDEKYTLASFFTTVIAFLVGYISLSCVYPNIKIMREKIIEFGYGVFFLLLAFDEYFEVHEYINTLIKGYLHQGELMGLLANISWIFPLSVIVLCVFVLLFIKIFYSPMQIKIPMIVGCCCVITVLIFELLGSITYGQHIYVYFVAAEEGMEMMGVTWFLLASLIETKSLSS